MHSFILLMVVMFQQWLHPNKGSSSLKQGWVVIPRVKMSMFSSSMHMPSKKKVVLSARMHLPNMKLPVSSEKMLMYSAKVLVSKSRMCYFLVCLSHRLCLLQVTLVFNFHFMDNVKVFSENYLQMSIESYVCQSISYLC